MTSQKKQSSSLKHISKIKRLRKQEPSAKELIKGIVEGDKAHLAKSITLVESSNQKHSKKANEIIEGCLLSKTDSIRIGITGVPGVGKSTFIEVFGKMLTGLGKKVAVLAVDPSSTLSKGSILGDKTRMELLAKDPKAFIRPSPSSESLGGVARKTRESIILCEAAGYNVILVETVGVGQSETVVHGMVDFFLLLKLAGAGDELQGIKRGIMEMADAVVINKADGTNKKEADKAKLEFKGALHLYPAKENNWSPKVLTCSALNNEGIDNVWKMIEDFIELTKNNTSFDSNRTRQNENWFLETVNDRLYQNFYNDKAVKQKLKSLLIAIKENKTSPFFAAKKLLELKNNHK
ncbi:MULTISPECIES: methylmalonyl Co-A mutase-associated GTPase MeaB [unclassified Croceitalea]|uniref:methylmalonyl Co-A mutase-associated GTPase MeaB n=1 Tax=unclassified Croceitalea TaxID=2632280 RepID=UPI0030D85E58